MDRNVSSLLMIHPTLPERRVALGFNLSALIFGTLWAYSEGLTTHGARMVAVDAGASLLASIDYPIGALALVLVKNFYCAKRGGEWLRRRLTAQGYRVRD